MRKISAVILCTREEGNIQQCLEHLNFVDEIVIINSGATERTLEICKRFTDRIIFHPWPSYAHQMEYACGVVRNEWVLNVDVNEVVSDTLRKHIISALENDRGKYDGYRIERHYFYSGQRVNYCWHPELQIRLYRKSSARWNKSNLHHSVEVEGKYRDLKGDLEYSPYHDLSQYLHIVDSLSSIEAREEFDKGKPEHLLHLVLSPVFHFFTIYGLKKGFLDGMPGFVISILESYRYFLESAKIWEMKNVGASTFSHSAGMNPLRCNVEKAKAFILPAKWRRCGSV